MNEYKKINDLIKNEKPQGLNTKLISDTHHTFGDLYEQRAYLFSSLLRCYNKLSFISKLHDDSTMFNGDFIAGIITPAGQYTFHFKLKYWKLFYGINVLDKAPKYDGHKPENIDRLLSLTKENK